MKTENTKAGLTAGPDAITAVVTELEAVHAKMTFVPPLTSEERARLATFGPRSSEVIQKRLEAAWSHRESLPPTFELRKFEKQARLVIELSKCQKTLERMLGDVRDTLRSIGPPVLAESKTVFGYLSVTAKGTGQVQSTVSSLTLRTRASRRSPASSVAAAKETEATAAEGAKPAPRVGPTDPAPPAVNPAPSKAA
jgi:hypothetical protein